MSRVGVSSRSDLADDARLGSRASDYVYETLANDDKRDAVVDLDEWLIEKKTLPANVHNQFESLTACRVVASTEKATLVTTTEEDDPDADEPGTAWVPDSSSRLYVRDGDLEELSDGSTLSDY